MATTCRRSAIGAGTCEFDPSSRCEMTEAGLALPILALNSGSSSLKFGLWRFTVRRDHCEERPGTLQLHRQTPVIVLTGDISTSTLREIAGYDCAELNKPVRLKELIKSSNASFPASRSAGHPTSPSLPTEASAISDRSSLLSTTTVIYATDSARRLRRDGRAVEDFATCEAFLEGYHPSREACLLVDAYLPGMSGLELLQHLSHSSHRLPAIMITGNGDVPTAVQAMKAGALDFIEKPFHESDLRASVDRALEQSRDLGKLLAWQESAANRIAALTPRHGRSWIWSSPAIPARISLPISASASARSRPTAPRS